MLYGLGWENVPESVKRCMGMRDMTIGTEDGNKKYEKNTGLPLEGL